MKLPALDWLIKNTLTKKKIQKKYKKIIMHTKIKMAKG